jgi:hypothetical protein
MAGIVAIHQPNFFPWLGYFDKIRQADSFVFLDAVAYPRSGSGGMGSWCNRVRISMQNEARWVTCPVRRMPLGTPIHDIQIDDAQSWRRILLKTLETNYRKAANFNAAMTILTPLILHPEPNLANFNIHAIGRLAVALGAEAKFTRQSKLPHSGHATELLVSLIKAAGGDSYLAGGGASGYQEDALFAANGVTLRYQKFMPSSYGPADKFIPGLSVIDYLMHDGRPLATAFPQD